MSESVGVVEREALAAARAGLQVVRLVDGDPFSDDGAVKEALAVARTAIPFEVVPGVPIELGAGSKGQG